MRLIASIILTALLAYVVGLYFPWWSVAVTSFIVALVFALRPISGWFAGFIAVFLLWACIAWVINSGNDGQLAGKIAQLMGLGNSPVLLIVVTAFIGGLVSGFAALSGSLLARINVARKA